MKSHQPMKTILSRSGAEKWGSRWRDGWISLMFLNIFYDAEGTGQKWKFKICEQIRIWTQVAGDFRSLSSVQFCPGIWRFIKCFILQHHVFIWIFTCTHTHKHTHTWHEINKQNANSYVYAVEWLILLVILFCSFQILYNKHVLISNLGGNVI